MQIMVLGSGAGGGYPQWNCRCSICALYWRKDPRVRRRTQSGLAVSADGERWLLLNCSPDIREQIAGQPRLWPNGKPRGSPIRAVAVTNGDVDHLGGLLSLRESAELDIYGTKSVLDQLAANPVFAVLDRKHVRFNRIAVGEAFSPLDGLSISAFEAPGKVPLYLENGEGFATGRSAFTIGLKVTSASGKSVAYVPGCAFADPQLLQDLAGCAAIFFDGTLWQDDEMIAERAGTKSGRRMGHLPVSGPGGSMAALRGLDGARKIFVHINNTNPLIVDGSPERQKAAAMGWEVAEDGMEIAL